MTPADIAAIVVRLDAQKDQLDRIEEHAQQTNGRVRALELWQAGVKGAGVALRWVPSLITGIVIGVVVFGLTHF